MVLWPLSSTILNPGLGLPNLNRGEYIITFNVEGYEISKTFEIR
jgi:hypothetical protein